MNIKELQKNWDAFGRSDPLWAILITPFPEQHRRDVRAFFASGREQIATVMRQVELLHQSKLPGLQMKRTRCLDFGCGMGRLTQALCDYFDEVHGVDIAPSMIRLARKYNRHKQCCFYHVNDTSDLRRFADDSFDFVYSLIVLQHMQPDYSKAYINEFLRVLAPGGLIIFQVTSEYQSRRALYQMPAGGYHAEIALETPLTTTSAGQSYDLTVRVKNRSSAHWRAVLPPGILYYIRLGNHWLDTSGSMLVQDDGRAMLPHDLAPGAEARIPLTVTAPPLPGDYLLEFDLVQEGITWFSQQGSPTLHVAVRNVATLRTRARRLLAAAARWSGALQARPAPTMEVYGLSKQTVIAQVEQHGGRIIGIQQDDWGGEEWQSFTYFVTQVT